MEIPLNAQVECTDGVCGQSAYVLIDPVAEEVTHLVVREGSFPNIEYIVPVEVVSETIANTILLHCSKAELEKMKPFIKTEFIEEVTSDRLAYDRGMYRAGSYYYSPYVTAGMTMQVLVEHQQVPPGELAMHRGTRVRAIDGYIGRVDEFVINPENGHITHLVMREGHLFGRKDVIIPLSSINETGIDTVYLKLDKHQIESLPTFPIHRRWF